MDGKNRLAENILTIIAESDKFKPNLGRIIMLPVV